MFSIQLRRQFSTSRVVQNVGFIGLGNMGRGMAKNLLDKGHAVVAFDTDSVTLKETVALGAKEAASPKEVASQCKQIITMLPNNDIVKTVYTCPTSFTVVKLGPVVLSKSVKSLLEDMGKNINLGLDPKLLSEIL